MSQQICFEAGKLLEVNLISRATYQQHIIGGWPSPHCRHILRWVMWSSSPLLGPATWPPLPLFSGQWRRPPRPARPTRVEEWGQRTRGWQVAAATAPVVLPPSSQAASALFRLLQSFSVFLRCSVIGSEGSEIQESWIPKIRLYHCCARRAQGFILVPVHSGPSSSRAWWVRDQRLATISNGPWMLSWYGPAARGERWPRRTQRCITRKSQSDLGPTGSCSQTWTRGHSSMRQRDWGELFSFPQALHGITCVHAQRCQENKWIWKLVPNSIHLETC